MEEEVEPTTRVEQSTSNYSKCQGYSVDVNQNQTLGPRESEASLLSQNLFGDKGIVSSVEVREFGLLSQNLLKKQTI